jgi:hypothetical protein
MDVLECSRYRKHPNTYTRCSTSLCNISFRCTFSPHTEKFQSVLLHMQYIKILLSNCCIHQLLHTSIVAHINFAHINCCTRQLLHTSINVLPDDGPVSSEACTSLVLKNIISNLVTILCIGWIKLKKLNYNARNGKYKTFHFAKNA